MTARVALTCLAGFVVAVLAQHLLAPELTPDVHTISEYVNADAGPLMVGGFVAWAASMAATARLVRRGARLVAWLLAVAAVGMLLTACFATQTSAGVLPPGIGADDRRARPRPRLRHRHPGAARRARHNGAAWRAGWRGSAGCRVPCSLWP